MKRLSKINQVVSVRLAAAALLGCNLLTANAQSLDNFDPNANGVVHVVLVQPDGKILLGGDFTALAPNGGSEVTRNHIARLNADGTLDSDFIVNANGTVRAIALQSDGKIIVGGDFAVINGQPRSRLARLAGSNGAADSFAPDCIIQ